MFVTHFHIPEFCIVTFNYVTITSIRIKLQTSNTTHLKEHFKTFPMERIDTEFWYMKMCDGHYRIWGYDFWLFCLFCLFLTLTFFYFFGRIMPFRLSLCRYYTMNVDNKKACILFLGNSTRLYYIIESKLFDFDIWILVFSAIWDWFK